MNTIYKLTAIFFLLMLFASCEQIVDLDLDSAPPRLVIDASITEDMPCIVILTKSQDFKDNGPYNRISGAKVRLTTKDGETEILEEALGEPGFYISEMLGVVNQKYLLEVTVGDEIYRASATVPEYIPINEVYIYEIKAGDKSWFSPSYIYNDPPYTDNYYYSLMYVNGKRLKSIYLNDDEHLNGEEIHRILFFDKDDNNDNDLETGDRVRIEMQNLDKGMYTYYQSLFSAANGGATNPITNFTGDVLGCFKAYNSSSIEMIVSSDRIYNEEKRVSL